MSHQRDADYYLDITQEVCPFTFVRTRLLLEKMKPGEIADILLQGVEPLENVPNAVMEQGHDLLSLTPIDEAEAEGPHLLRIRRC